MMIWEIHADKRASPRNFSITNDLSPCCPEPPVGTLYTRLKYSWFEHWCQTNSWLKHDVQPYRLMLSTVCWNVVLSRIYSGQEVARFDECDPTR